jgi:hypothetical protein
MLSGRSHKIDKSWRGGAAADGASWPVRRAGAAARRQTERAGAVVRRGGEAGRARRRCCAAASGAPGWRSLRCFRRSCREENGASDCCACFCTRRSASADISLLLAARAAQYDTMMKLVIHLPRESDLTRYVVIQMKYCLRLDQKSDAGFGLTSNVP